MPRRPRLSTGGIAYHVLNRRVGRLELFEKPADYSAFEKILAEAHRHTGIRVAAYCLMPNHWHMVLWPRKDGEMTAFLRWLTLTHSQRLLAHRHTTVMGTSIRADLKVFRLNKMNPCSMCCGTWSAMHCERISSAKRRTGAGAVYGEGSMEIANRY